MVHRKKKLTLFFHLSDESTRSAQDSNITGVNVEWNAMHLKRQKIKIGSGVAFAGKQDMFPGLKCVFCICVLDITRKDVFQLQLTSPIRPE